MTSKKPVPNFVQTTKISSSLCFRYSHKVKLYIKKANY